MTRRLAAEALGTGVLTAAVVGSGIMAARLTSDVGLQLLINALATVSALGAMIACLDVLSGAHFNPAVTVVAAARREMAPAEAGGYLVVQLAGGITGAVVADLMFSLPAVDSSAHQRGGAGLLLGEVVATAGLLLVIGGLTRTGRAQLGAVAVPAWILAAYFFTASTSFANPAVTVARSLSDTFAGIAPADVAPFIAAQLVGAALGAAATELLFPRSGTGTHGLPEVVHDHS